jgi:hypothetical protein
MKKVYLSISLIALIIGILSSCGVFQSKIDYNAQVKPILNKNCISCHGGVKKQGGFSLLFREEALASTKSGKLGIVPGDADASEMFKRLISKDPEMRMPHKRDPLKDEEIAIIEKWINQGAEFSTHWAYKPLEKVETPETGSDWVSNFIDEYIYQNAEKNGLDVSKQAEPAVLARRVALDLVGMPIEIAEKKSYLNNPTPANYEKYVDALLKSPQYGEKWTSMWLDLARYADTKGYERDAGRRIWKYRDWLIKSFNDDLPYDKFLTHQLAGDLLPDANENTFIATAFHRNSMTNDEGGTDNEEFRIAANIDRVNTTWETLMSTTFACVQCHSHPYDPFTHEDYYKFMSFFNNSRDEDTFDDYPVYRHYGSKDSTRLAETKQWLAKNVSQQEKREIELFLTTLQPSYNSITMTDFQNSELSDTKFLVFRNPSSAWLKKVDLTSIKSLILSHKKIKEGGVLEIFLDKKEGQKIATYRPDNKKSSKWDIIELPLIQTTGVHDLYFSYSNPKIKDIKENGLMFNWLHFKKELPGKEKEGFETFKINYDSLIATKPEMTTPVFVENPKSFFRKNQVFERGNFLTKTTEVSPGLPKAFGYSEKMNDRLDLAKWMTSKKNPLVARTMTNRLWEQIFGQGLVETLEDMGSQGAKPVNQQLLDDLSWRFMNEYGWSIKKMIKTIVMSSTYKQNSQADEKTIKKDKFNLHLARGARVRLSGEQIRDQALYISGAYNTKMYGPPVKPYQPEGIWGSPYNGEKWKIDTAQNNQYRRAIYTYWKRTSAYPSLTTFDGVGREVCISRRIRTNTPLQAFVTLNDSSYVDMAYIFAKNVLKKSNNDSKKAIQAAYFKATGKQIIDSKMTFLEKLYSKTFNLYKNNKRLSQDLCKTDDPNLAAMVVVCNTILNLDEVITKS